MKDKSTHTKNKATSGFVWVFFGTAGQNLLQFFALLVLARLLTPNDFGIVSASMIVVGLIGIFSELGIGPAIVQKINLTKEDIGTGKIISTSIGLFTALLLYSTADLFESFMRMDGLSNVVKWLAFVLPISGLTVIGQSLLQRNLEFRKYIFCIFVSYFVSQLMVAVPMAYFGYGYYALIWATLAQNIILLITISYLTRQYNYWFFDFKSAKQLVNYGFGQSLGKFSNYLAGQGDNFIIGRYLGASSLGIYGRSYQLLMVPTNLIGSVLDKVLFPIMSVIQQDNKKLSEIYLLSMSIVAMICTPVIVVVFLSSSEIVQILLGNKWIEAAPVLKILISVLFFRISYKVSDALSRAKGSVYRRAWRQAIFALSVFVFSYAGSFYGIEGVAYGVIISIFINYLLMLSLSQDLIKFEYKKIILILVKNIFVFFIVLAVVGCLSSYLKFVFYINFLIISFFVLVVNLLVLFMARRFFMNEILFVKKYSYK